ncbi:MAG: shikimate dehydrogenase [Gemmatimonadota bacterium]
MSITSSTRVLALLGDPVRHSFSPVIHNAAFELTGMDGVYVTVRCGEADLAGFMRGRSLYGDNTDVAGFRAALRGFVGDPSGMQVLLLGAGGAARATLMGLLEEGVDEVVLLNRTEERSRAVARRIGGSRARVASSIGEIRGGSFDLVINSTSLGLSAEDPLPLDLEVLSRVGAVMDLIYGSQDTPFVRGALERGVRATDGSEMLVHQGAASFQRWWSEEAPVEAMRDALRRVREG